MEAQLATKLEEYFQCGLCNKPATSPKLLECLHTFCAGCLERECNGSYVTCPICEMVTKKGLSSLPDNIFVSNLQNSVRKQQQILESAEQCCASCEENTSAEFVCLECDKVLCNKCLHTHQVLMPDHKKHMETLGTLRKLNSDEFLKILRRSKDLLCSSHENQTISLYCRTCSMWLCVLCALLEHKDHDCTPVRKQINLLKNELQETLAAMVTKQEEFVESQSQLEQLVDDVNRDKYKLANLIKARVQAALQKVKEEELRLLNELQELHSSKTQKLQVSLNSIENVLKRMEVSKNVVSQLLRYATEQEILKLQGTIKSALAELREEKPMDVHVDSTIIDFQECCKFPEKMLGNLMITRLKHESTLDGKSPLPGCRIAVHCNKEVGESSKCNFNKRKCYAAPETSKKLCVKEEPSSCTDDDSTPGPSSHQQSRTPSIECVTVITDSNRQEQVSMFMDTVVIVREDGAGDAMQRESGAEMPSGGQDGLQQSTAETLVFFDLETTGLENDCEIVQLLAVSGEKIFNKYILPSKPISEGAFAITGFQVLDGVLYLRGEPLQVSSLRDTLEAFLHFLQSLASPLIIGDNIWKFDAPILLRVLQELSMKDQFDSCITGFLDTLLLAKVVVPRSEVNSYRQNELVKVFLKKGYNAHNAVEDAKRLQELYSVLKFTPEQKKSSQFSFSQLECQVSLWPLLKENIIFSQLADKLAMQGVSFEKLQSTDQQDGEAGLKNFLHSLGHIEPSYIRLSRFFMK